MCFYPIEHFKISRGKLGKKKFFFPTRFGTDFSVNLNMYFYKYNITYKN